MRALTQPGGASSRSRRQIIKRFRQAGFEVMVASEVLEALTLLQQRPGLLVLLRIEPVPGAAEEQQPLTLPQTVH
jgi:superfamily II DNA/RNA helicase